MVASRLMTALAIVVGVASFGMRMAAPGSSAGSATILDPSSNQPLNSGGSQVVWTIGLPPQAKCTKDTATNAYHVFSYIVPSAVNPNSLSFTSTGPADPTANALDYPLVDAFGSPYIAANTAPQTGQVIQIPQFNWAGFSIDGRNGKATLPAGAYNVGIACATGGGVEDVFWNVAITFAASSTDPAGETWTAANPGGGGGGTTTTTTTGGSTTTTTGGSTTTTTSGGTTTTTSGGTTTTTSGGTTSTSAVWTSTSTTPSTTSPSTVPVSPSSSDVTTSSPAVQPSSNGAVSAASASSPSLAYTGTQVLIVLMIGAALLGVGAVVVMGARQRRRDDPPA
jgi:hypothetical protein